MYTVCHVQVLLDLTHHEELADYIRLVVYESTNPFAGAALNKSSPRGGSKAGSSSQVHRQTLARRVPTPSGVGDAAGNDEGLSFTGRTRAQGVVNYAGHDNDGLLTLDRNRDKSGELLQIYFAVRLLLIQCCEVSAQHNGCQNTHFHSF